MSKEKILAMQKQVTGKLMAAISMLLVSAILMCLTSYAWFILSTAPEVSNLKTTAGANGALEIALQSTNTDGNGRAEITSAVGSSHAVKSAAESNTYWGNVVDLTEGYGLEHVTLYPARLKLTPTKVDGKTSYAVDTGTILQVPQFGQDGRVTGLLDATKTHYDGGKFTTGNNWGVNVLGAVSENVGEEDTIVLTYARDIVLEQAREKVAAYRAELRSDMKNLIERNSLGIMGLMAAVVKIDFLTPEQQYYTVKDYVTSIAAIISDSTDAIRWALLANAAADETNFKSGDDEDMKRLGELYASYMQKPLTASNDDEPIAENENLEREGSVKRIAEKYGYTEVAKAAEAITACSVRVKMAEDEINDDGKTIGNAGLMLVKPTEIMMHGSKGETGVEAIWIALGYDFTNVVEKDTIYALALTTDLSDTNLFSAVAAVIGDYTGDMTVWLTLNDKGKPTNMLGQEPTETTNYKKCVYTIKATSGSSYDKWKDVDDLSSIARQEDGKFAEDSNVGTLGVVLNQIEGIVAPGTIQVKITRSDVTAYGYSADLAFRASKSTNLLLQQKGITRVSGDDSGSETGVPDTMGGGSEVQFTVPGDMSEDQVKNLLQGLYIVFMNTKSGTIYKVAAVDASSVKVSWTDIPASVTATLALYEPAFGEDGTLSLGQSAGNVITALVGDEAIYISAVVYLSGDAVDSTMFSATQGISLDGKINLQFASSETLTPMTYSDYVKANGTKQIVWSSKKSLIEDTDIKRSVVITKRGAFAA